MIYVLPAGTTPARTPETERVTERPAKFEYDAVPYLAYRELGKHTLMLVSEYSLEELLPQNAADKLRFGQGYVSPQDGRMRFFDAWHLRRERVDITKILVHLSRTAMSDFRRIAELPVLITPLCVSEFLDTLGKGQAVEITKALTLTEGLRYTEPKLS